MPNYDYTPEQLRQMQQEAAARVREMQRRARARLEGTSEPVREHRPETGHPAGQPVHTPGDIPRLSPPVPPPHGNHAQAPSGGLGNILGQLGMPGGMGELLGGQGDSDRTMLMMLLMLLSTQGNCSPGLIAALFWLMMG